MNSRSKGCRAEREVAATIQEWWRPHEPQARFVRTPSSGGWATPELRGEFKVAGDLTTSAREFPFTVEVKHRQGWRWAPLLDGRRSPVLGWWAQAEKAALEERRVPLLWFRHNGEPWHLMLPYVLLHALGWQGAVTSLWAVARVVWDPFDSPDPKEAELRARGGVSVVEWEEFRALEPPAVLAAVRLAWP